MTAQTMSQMPVEGKVIEIACGEGHFTFLTLGGTFHPEFDVYLDLSLPPQEASPSSVDIFDAPPQNEELAIKSPAFRKVDLGVDLKVHMTEKAKKLGLYESVVTGDITSPHFKISPTFDTLFCFNAIMHFESLPQALSNMHQCLNEKASAYISVYLPCFYDFYSKLENFYSPQAYHLLERQMKSIWPSLFSVRQWQELFGQHHFKTLEAIPLVKNTFPPFWNIGLRPFASELIPMAQLARKQSEKEAQAIKTSWVKKWALISEPFMQPAAHLDEACTVLFKLQKQSSI